jgi:hypothetical protein
VNCPFYPPAATAAAPSRLPPHAGPSLRAGGAARGNLEHPKAWLAPHQEALARVIERHLGPGGVGSIAPGSRRRFERCKRVIEGWTAAS